MISKVKFPRLLIEEIWYVCHNVIFGKLQNGFLYIGARPSIEVLYSNLKLQLILKVLKFLIMSIERFWMPETGCFQNEIYNNIDQ